MRDFCFCLFVSKSIKLIIIVIIIIIRPELVTLGECDLIDEIIVGEDHLIRFSGCKGGAACTIILRGASSHLLDEAERSLHDALCVLTETVKETRVVCGGGCTKMLMAQAIDSQVLQTSSLSHHSITLSLLYSTHICICMLFDRFQQLLANQLLQWKPFHVHYINFQQ